MKVGYVVLYEDGELVISKEYTILQKPILENFGEFDAKIVPWQLDDMCFKIKQVRILDKVKTNYMRSWFQDCLYLTTLLDFQNLDVSDCKDFSYAFYSCLNLNSLVPLKDWNVSNGVTFKRMFMKCTSLETLKGLNTWDVSNGENFYGMFRHCETLKDMSSLKNWNVSNGEDFMDMFYNCRSLINIEMGNWNLSNGKYFSNMICNCICLKIIQLPNTLKKLNYQIFKDCNLNLNISWKGKNYMYDDLIEYQEF